MARSIHPGLAIPGDSVPRTGEYGRAAGVLPVKVDRPLYWSIRFSERGDWTVDSDLDNDLVTCSATSANKKCRGKNEKCCAPAFRRGY
jgi:hypothetical protein